MNSQVLVTGFQKFGNHNENISEQIANSLSGQKVRGHEIIVNILSVDEAGSRYVSKIYNQHDFKAILHIGLAENALQPRIELRAKDILNFSIPDNSGRLINNTPITGQGDLFCLLYTSPSPRDS